MDYYDMVLKSIDAFMKGKEPQELAKLKEGGLRYTKSYFDELEKDFESEAPEISETDDD